MFLNKNILAQLGGMATGIMTFVVIGITIVIAALILGNFDSMTDSGGAFENTEANSAVKDTLESVTTFSGLLPVLALVIIAGYILSSLGIFGGTR